MMGSVNVYCAICCGSISSLITAAFCISFGGYNGVIIFLAFMLGFGLADIMVEMINGSLLSLFVCICEIPASLESQTPEFYAYLYSEKYQKVCYNLFRHKV